ncbi:MAG TPA: zinc-binding alcohol dehydrogenase family protein [Acidobacteriaceae bacterium]|jgi:2-desacetyl-2-hydroxyethyl bacteriochlorophyllide A dehydrogenase|nr:zinc-binding alcohol dehydrogenase family protein [Acidobacteriaceae bacterium]
MKQIVLAAPRELIARQVPRPKAKEGEALVRIRQIGVCGSDFHAYAGDHPAYTYPRVLGHELACEIVDIPDNRLGLRVGDRCAIEPYISCGKCHPCVMGRTNCCEQLRLFGVHVDGGMQAFLSVPLSLLHKSEVLSVDQLALVETLGIGAHAVARSGLGSGETVLVIGAGPIGLAVAQFAKVAGGIVRIIEKSEWRRDFAKYLGFPILTGPDNELADVVFDATGNSASMAASLNFVASAGRLVFVGLTREVIAIDDALLHKREVTLYSSRNSAGQFARIIKLIESNQIDIRPWITDRLVLSDVPVRLIDLASRSNFMKALIEVADRDT